MSLCGVLLNSALFIGYWRVSEKREAIEVIGVKFFDRVSLYTDSDET